MKLKLKTAEFSSKNYHNSSLEFCKVPIKPILIVILSLFAHRAYAQANIQGQKDTTPIDTLSNEKIIETRSPVTKNDGNRKILLAANDDETSDNQSQTNKAPAKSAVDINLNE
ncbi:MAG: hypothetical protein HOO90_05510, partial [Methylotenera sp.]|uniref:hypothetical protein n=1 Tax=Methylotenera sp. TaxID=2051956 RepID=UPI0017A28B49